MGRTDVTGVRNTCGSINSVQAAIESAFKEAQRGVAACYDEKKIDPDLLRELFDSIATTLEGKADNEMEEIRDDNSNLRTFGTNTEERRVELENECDRLQTRVNELKTEVEELESKQVEN